MLAYHFSLVSLAILVASNSILLLWCVSPTEALNVGFSVELIHRDSPTSPFYNPTESRSQRVANALSRSINRANHFNSVLSVSLNAAESDVTNYGGEYLMSYSVGTPPTKILGVADTGSDLTWLQCKPCESCYNQAAPLFDPSQSKTYQNVPCSSSQCQAFREASCLSNDRTICQYSVNYGDRSFSEGDLALDTLTLGSTDGNLISFPRTLIGCGHDNDGTFNDKGSGIVGLGGGSVSLISQLDSSIGGRFSYCLIPIYQGSTKSSKLNFGDNAVVSGYGSVSTPIVQKSPETFYYLTLDAISVGENRLEYASSKGNIIIDSGTSVTFLPEELYSRLESAVANVVNLERAEDPEQLLSLCYRTTSKQVDIPPITAHFEGADLKLNDINAFVEVADGVVCLAFKPSQRVAIFGNLAQMNFLVGYDLQKKTVSFKPTDCSKL